MRISLENLDARGLSLDLDDEQRVLVRSAEGLGGALEQERDHLRLSDARTERIVLDTLRLVFGNLILTGSAALDRAGLALDQRSGHLTLDLDARAIDAPELGVVVDSVSLGGRVKMSDVRLEVRDAEGRIQAKHVTFAGFRLRFDDAQVTAETLTAVGMAIAWGAAGFRIEASLVEATGVKVALSLSADEADAPGAAEDGAPSAEPGSALVDWGALDGLGGDINADVAVDLTVPILGRRQATHRFRIPVDRGMIDFRQLENDLSTLENSLLDFAVRDGALVLERGIPILPTRGRGKPIVVWALDANDLVLAEQNRVRLSVLPRARLAGEPTPEGEESSSSFALRRLGVVTETKIFLAPVEGAAALSGQLRPRSIGSLALSGQVFHDAEGAAKEGLLRGEILDVDAALVGLALGSSRLDIGRLRIARAAPVEIAFKGLSPRRARLEIDAMSLESIALR